MENSRITKEKDHLSIHPSIEKKRNISQIQTREQAQMYKYLEPNRENLEQYHISKLIYFFEIQLNQIKSREKKNEKKK